MKDIVNIAVVGLGPIGSLHVKNLLSQKIAGARLACICEQRGADSAQYGGVPIFTDLDEMLKSRSFDAAVISTPSFTHYPLAKKILQAGYDVLVEKPVALCTSDAEDLRETARKLGKVCAVMLNQRTNALYSKIRDLVVSGRLGEIDRVSWTMTSWYRPNIYFTSSPWRGTWKGEAGGALVNQSIHNLDIFAWTFGVPEKLRAWCEFGKYHDIEVEDEVVCRMKLKARNRRRQGIYRNRRRRFKIYALQKRESFRIHARYPLCVRFARMRVYGGGCFRQGGAACGCYAEFCGRAHGARYAALRRFGGDGLARACERHADVGVVRVRD